MKGEDFYIGGGGGGEGGESSNIDMVEEGNYSTEKIFSVVGKRNISRCGRLVFSVLCNYQNQLILFSISPN